MRRWNRLRRPGCMPQAAPSLLVSSLRVTIPFLNSQGRLRHPSGHAPSPHADGKACAMPVLRPQPCCCKPMSCAGRWPADAPAGGFFPSGIFSPLPRFLRLPESLLFLVTPAGGFRKTLFYKPSTRMRAQKKRYFPGAKTQGNGEKKRKSRHGKNSRRARNLGSGEM